MPNYTLLANTPGLFVLTGGSTLDMEPSDPAGLTREIPSHHRAILRKGRYYAVNITNDLATTQTVNLCGTSLGHIYIPSIGPTTIVPYCSPDISGIHLPFLPYAPYDSVETPWVMVAGKCNEFPTSAFSMSYTRFVMTAGTAGTVYFFIKG